jgi:uncharacterized LabA/DUF88 family protein
MNERIAVFIDGSNLYFKLRSPYVDIKHLIKFDYKGLIKWLAQDRDLVHLGYYVGVVRAEKDNKRNQVLRKQQQRLFSHLTCPAQNFIIKKGYILGNDGIYHEKGVDVQLSVDLLVGAYEDSYDVAIVISSDTDLLPAIKKVKILGKKIIYVGFSFLPSLALQKHADFSRLLIKEDLLPFEFHS